MTTYVILRNRIANEVRTVSTAAASDIASEIASSVLSAVKFYEREEFYFNTKTATFSTVAAQEYYSSSDLADIANLITIYSLNVTVTGTKLPLTPMSFDDIDDAQDSAVTGDPEYFAYFKQNLRLYPIPSAVRTMTMAYCYRLTALSGDSDSNAWTTDAEELIRSRAKADLYANVLDNQGRADQCKAWEMEALRALKRESRKRRSNGILRMDPAITAPRRFNIYSG